MDETRALFKKVKGRDAASFDALSENYGWKLYSYIRKNTQDRASADRIFSDTFSRFYDAVEGYEGEDPIEALLFSCADQSAGEASIPEKGEERPMGQWAIGQEAGFSLPPVHAQGTMEKRDPLWLRLFYGISIVLLVIGILAALWIMAYMLMSMNLIPAADIGYSWFNTHIANLF